MALLQDLIDRVDWLRQELHEIPAKPVRSPFLLTSTMPCGIASRLLTELTTAVQYHSVNLLRTPLAE